MRRIPLVLTCMGLAASVLLVSPASATDVPPPTNVTAPTVTGDPRFGHTLTADPGTWDPDGATFTYAWFRDGTQVGSGPTHALTSENDLGHTFAVQVVATAAGPSSEPVSSTPTAAIRRATITNTGLPEITGTLRFRQTLTRSRGTWSTGGLSYSTRWYRDGKAISHATGKHYTLSPSDVGSHITVVVKVSKYGHHTASAVSHRTGTIHHLRAVRKTVTYHVTTRGTITASLATFKKLAADTYADPRGWRGMGVRFVQVKGAGDFTLVLSQASKVPSFSSGCSSTYSCRVGRYVIINQTRWQHASPAWHDHNGSLRNYRNLVINHETGHWLGKGHAKCGGNGELAPVMQQQSKGLQGCKINPWPKPSELHSPRFGF